MGALHIVPLTASFSKNTPIYGIMMDVGKPNWEQQVYFVNGDSSKTVRLHLRSGIKGFLGPGDSSWRQVSNYWFFADGSKYFTLYNDSILSGKIDVLYYSKVTSSSWQDGHVFLFV